jgi:hypothetical protein
MYCIQNYKDGVKIFQDERLSLKGAKKEKKKKRNRMKEKKTREEKQNDKTWKTKEGLCMSIKLKLGVLSL